jgi:hypothetical protein
MFGIKRQSSKIQSTNQTKWMETSSIKKLAEISNKQERKVRLETIWNKRETLIRAKIQIFVFVDLSYSHTQNKAIALALPNKFKLALQH